MDSIISNIQVFLPFALVPWLLLAIGVWRGPQRFRNSFLLLVAIFFTLPLIAGLFGDHMPQALVAMAILAAVAVFCVPLVLVANGIIMLRKEGRSLANLLSLLFGLLVGIGEVALVAFVLGSPGATPLTALQKALGALGLSVLYLCIVFLAFMLYTLFVQRIPHRRDLTHVVIHGCGLLHGREVSKLLSNRLDAAIRVYERSGDPDHRPVLIPSGGQGPDEKTSEAHAMAEYLIEHGIPASHIVEEAASANTYENLVNSKAIIDAAASDLGVGSTSSTGTPSASRRTRPRPRVALVTSNYHVYRCLRLAKDIGLKCTGIGAKVAWYYWPSAVIREFVAVFSQKRMLLLLIAGWLFFIAPFLVLVLAG